MHKTLIIDDNYSEVQSLIYALDIAGHRVFHSLRGEDGIDIARKHNPDIIICDITMPGISGFDVVRVLKLDPRTKNIPVIMLTAHEEENTVVQSFDLDADDYVKKPYSIKEMLARIDRLINRHKKNEAVLIQYGQLWLSPRSKMAFIEGRKVELSFKETLILNKLINHPGQTVTTEQLSAVALGVTNPTRADKHTIATHIYNLRHRKLKLESTRATHIYTDGHRGYRLVSQETGLELTPVDATYIQKITNN